MQILNVLQDINKLRKVIGYRKSQGHANNFLRQIIKCQDVTLRFLFQWTSTCSETFNRAVATVKSTNNLVFSDII